MPHLVLFATIVIAGTGGEICVSRAMKSMGADPRFHPVEIARFIMRAMRISWMWVGVGLMAAAFFSLLGALSIYNVSFVVPVTALSYVAGASGGALFLGERVTAHRWLGVMLVTIGVTLVVLG
jgi:drug/metabolite transporter (DMT)-like permease